MGLRATHSSPPSPLPSCRQAWNPEIPQMGGPIKIIWSNLSFSIWEACQRGKGTCPRAPSRSLRTLELTPGLPPSCLCSLSSHSHSCHPLPHHWGCSSFSLSLSILLPVLPRPACCLTSPLICSPIAASAFSSRPLEPGEAPYPLFLLSLLVPLSMSWGYSWDGLPLPFHFLLTPRGI